MLCITLDNKVVKIVQNSSAVISNGCLERRGSFGPPGRWNIIHEFIIHIIMSPESYITAWLWTYLITGFFIKKKKNTFHDLPLGGPGPNETL